MIPRRIKLKGFMSFRREAELLFDGSALWVLTGPNGAGKSAIFDAIAFALYGVHRTNDIDLKGMQDTKALINHNEEGLEVEFEFAIGDEIFCVKRTLQKARRSPTYQVFRHTKANGSGQAKSNWVLVPGTHLRAGFDSWVTENIGLDPKAFTAAVFLGQGKSDALLCHKPEMRHKILSQIIDISAYERLHNKAKDHYEESRSDANSYKQQLDGIPVVDDNQVTELTSKTEQKAKRVEAARTQLEEIILRKNHAERWNELVKEKSVAEQALRETQDLLAKAEKIESDARRLEKLGRLIPLAERLLKERQRLALSDAKITQHKNTAEKCGKEEEGLSSEADLAQKQYDQLKQRQDDAQQQLAAAHHTISELSLQLPELNEMDKLRSRLKQYDQSLASYPADLDKKIARLNAEVEELEELKRVISPLERYCEARSEWREAKIQSKSAQARVSQLKALLSAETERHKKLENKKEEAEISLESVRQKAAEVRARVKDIEERLGRFGEVDGRPACDYCGQKLTPEHLDSERKRIETRLKTARKAEQDAEKNVKDATANRRSNTQELKKSTESLEQLRDDDRRADESLREATKDQKRTEKQGAVIIKELPSSYSTRMAPNATADINSYFEAAYPASDELTDLRKRAALYEVRKRDFAKLQKDAAERDRIIVQRGPESDRLSEFEARYPVSRATAIRKTYEEATKAQAEKKQLSDDLKQLLSKAEKSLEKLKVEASAARDKRQHASTQAKEEQARREELARIVSDKESDLVREGQDEATSLTDKQLTRWQEEESSLKGADARLAGLEEARHNKEHRKLRLNQIARDIERIPQNAQCPLAVIAEQESELRNTYAAAEKARREAEQQKQMLEDRRERRRDLESKYNQAARKERLYRELARLLGHEYLQRHLLQQAETGIIGNANEVLDRVSSGTLHLELTPDDDADNAQRSVRSPNKALDLVAFHSETGGVPMPVDFLSGSQRFRVAVSLALGIGRYASQGTRRIESVIIDEGFGSLDKTGRQEMIDELHLLRDELKRIILVSHQEEIAEAFNNKYKVELVEGGSRVSLVS